MTGVKRRHGMKIRNRWLRSQWKRFRIWRCKVRWDSIPEGDSKSLLLFLGFDPKSKIEKGDFDN